MPSAIVASDDPKTWWTERYQPCTVRVWLFAVAVPALSSGSEVLEAARLGRAAATMFARSLARVEVPTSAR